ncbi:MAG: Jag N-terminal domain-containing protein [Clostridiales bacterium]|nr:Jag N-terminal domain-containing protein [Clostridiales bacterium]
MTKYIETTGKTEDLAIAAALEQLGMDRDDVSVEIINRAKTGFLGIGSCPARVRVSYEAPDPVPVKEPEPVASVAAPVEPQEAPEKKPAAPGQKKPVNKRPANQQPRPKKKEQPRKPEASGKEPAAEAQTMVQAKEPAAPAADRTGDIVAFLTGLMEHLDVEATPVVRINEDGIYEVNLEGEDLGALIGRRGETLDAIQQLTNYAMNHGQNHRIRVHVDCENYRAKREESLQRLARKTAGKAVKYRRNMMLEPMNAYERHVIHAELQDYHPNISTYSTGTEPNRRIVVAYNK